VSLFNLIRVVNFQIRLQKLFFLALFSKSKVVEIIDIFTKWLPWYTTLSVELNDQSMIHGHGILTFLKDCMF